MESMILAFLSSRELFTLPWLTPMLVGLLAPIVAIPIARARFGPLARWRAAHVFVLVDIAAVIMAVLTSGDNPIPILTIEIAPIGVIIAIFTIARRGGKLPANVCQVCGYDLRATPSRCPECGTIPSQE